MNRLTVVGLKQDKEAVIDALMKLGGIEVDQSETSAEMLIGSNRDEISQPEISPGPDKPLYDSPEKRSSDSIFKNSSSAAAGATLDANRQKDDLSIKTDSQSDPITDFDASRTAARQITEVKNQLTVLSEAITFLQSQNTEKKPVFAAKRAVSGHLFSETASRHDEIYDAAVEIEKRRDRRRQVLTEITRLDARIELLAHWIELDLDLADLSTHSVHFYPGSFDTVDQLDAFRAFIGEEAPETDLEIISEDEKGIRCIVYTWKPREAIVRSGLRRLGFDLFPIQGQKGKPSELYHDAKKQKRFYQKELSAIEDKNKESLDLLQDLEILYDYCQIQYDRLQVMAGLPATEYTFWLEGWVPAALSNSIEQGLRSKFIVATSKRQPNEGESHPIIMKNNRFVKSYEVIVEMFSPPSTREMDPSPLLAPFFFFFFGMMLSDVGYGIMMTSLCAFLLFKVKVSGEMARMSRMLFMSGVASAVWGIIFGGFFGDMLSVLSSDRIAFPSLWFNPMDDPTKLMIWSMLFGVLHIFVGMGARAYMLIQYGQAKDAVFDIFPWYILLTGLGLMIGGIGGQTGLYMVLLSAAVLILFGGRTAKNPVLRVLKGILSLYSITGYFSDILSYTRILALVLATSVIAMVVNLLGFLLGPTPLGILVFIFVAVGGHVLNLALSALSAYVHTSRLHFVEFFSKFYEGGGRMWQPLKLKTKYIDISREDAS